MTPRRALHYYDRRSGRIETERVFAAGFLHWSYNSVPGRFCTRAFLSRRIVSRLGGLIARTRLSRKLIAPFARRARVDVTRLERPLAAYRSFNDFFTRASAPGLRLAVGPDSLCISPVDGRVYVIERLELDRTFRVKRSLFDLRKLVADDALAARYAGGTAVICRLMLADYHGVHFPVSGLSGRARAIDGRLYAGGPYAERWRVPFYTDNYRMVTRVASERFGLVTLIEIGAFTVGSIRQYYREGAYAQRGDLKARFEIGGSTVVLLFARGAIRIDTDILQCARAGLETRLYCGDSLGRATATRARIGTRALERAG